MVLSIYHGNQIEWVDRKSMTLLERRGQSLVCLCFEDKPGTSILNSSEAGDVLTMEVLFNRNLIILP